MPASHSHHSKYPCLAFSNICGVNIPTTEHGLGTRGLGLALVIQPQHRHVFSQGKTTIFGNIPNCSVESTPSTNPMGLYGHLSSIHFKFTLSSALGFCLLHVNLQARKMQGLLSAIYEEKNPCCPCVGLLCCWPETWEEANSDTRTYGTHFKACLCSVNFSSNFVFGQCGSGTTEVLMTVGKRSYPTC